MAGRGGALAFAVALLAASCGDDGGGGAATDVASSTTGVEQTTDPEPTPPTDPPPTTTAPPTTSEGPAVITLDELNETGLFFDGVLHDGEQFILPQIIRDADGIRSAAALVSPNGDEWTPIEWDLPEMSQLPLDVVVSRVGTSTVLRPIGVLDVAQAYITQDMVSWERIVVEPPDLTLDQGLRWLAYTRVARGGRTLVLGHRADIDPDTIGVTGVQVNCPAPCRDSYGFGDNRVTFDVDLDARFDRVFLLADDGSYEEIPAPAVPAYDMLDTAEGPMIVDYALRGPVDAAVWNGSAWTPRSVEALSNFLTLAAHNGRQYTAVGAGEAVEMFTSTDGGTSWVSLGVFAAAEPETGGFARFAAGPGDGVAFTLDASPTVVLYAPDGVTFAPILIGDDAADRSGGRSSIALGADRLAYVEGRQLQFVDLPG